MLSASLNKTFLSRSVKQHSFPLCLKVLHCVVVMSPGHAAPVYIHRMHACVCMCECAALCSGNGPCACCTCIYTPRACAISVRDSSVVYGWGLGNTMHARCMFVCIASRSCRGCCYTADKLGARKHDARTLHVCVHCIQIMSGVFLYSAQTDASVSGLWVKLEGRKCFI